MKNYYFKLMMYCGLVIVFFIIFVDTAEIEGEIRTPQLLLGSLKQK